MTELALTRIFSVTMYYHFAFLAISIALFGLSASGVYVFVARRRLARARRPRALLARPRARVTRLVTVVVAVRSLVRLRVGLNYSPENLRADAGDLRAGGAAVLRRRRRHLAGDLAARRAHQRSSTRPDLIGAAAGCLLLHSAAQPTRRARRRADGRRARRRWPRCCFAPPGAPDRRRDRRPRSSRACRSPRSSRAPRRSTSRDTKGHDGDRVLFSKWNSFSRVGVYDRAHGDWSLSPRYTGPMPESRFMDIDSAASTPILRFAGRPRRTSTTCATSYGARLPAPRTSTGAARDAAVHGARHRPRRRPRPAVGARLRRRPRRRRRDQPDHRATT